MAPISRLFLFLTLFSFFSCKNLTTDKIVEGTIEYEISYPFPEETTISAELMPKTLTYQFKEGYTLSTIAASMGVFNTYIITDREKKKITQGLSIMGKKYKVEFDKDKIAEMVGMEPKMNIQLTEDTKMIAGYKCKKAICTFPDTTLPALEVFYTNDIMQEKANWYSTYKEIDGVLMEFYIKRYDIHMKLTAKNVLKDPVDNKVFQLEGDYKTVSAAEMDSYFKI
jgi:GLPGLI family protein